MNRQLPQVRAERIDVLLPPYRRPRSYGSGGRCLRSVTFRVLREQVQVVKEGLAVLLRNLFTSPQLVATAWTWKWVSVASKAVDKKQVSRGFAQLDHRPSLQATSKCIEMLCMVGCKLFLHCIKLYLHVASIQCRDKC